MRNAGRGASNSAAPIPIVIVGASRPVAHVMRAQALRFATFPTRTAIRSAALLRAQQTLDAPRRYKGAIYPQIRFVPCVTAHSRARWKARAVGARGIVLRASSATIR